MGDQDLQVLNKEIGDLRAKLNELESKKEQSFREYKRVKDELAKKISEDLGYTDVTMPVLHQETTL